MWDILLAEDPQLDLVDMVCVAMLLRIRWQCKLAYRERIPLADHINSDKSKLFLCFDIAFEVSYPHSTTWTSKLCG